MTRHPQRLAARRGSTIFEFAIVTVVLMLVILGALELCRMVLVYTTLANSARWGLRYAIVHGADRTGAGVNGPSGPAANPPQVVTAVKNLASAGTVNPAGVVVAVTYPSGSNAPGANVRIRVTYVYDPMTLILPLGVTLAAMSEGIITF